MRNNASTGKDSPVNNAEASAEEEVRKKEILFHGVPASPGIAIGQVLLVDSNLVEDKQENDRLLTDEEVEGEISLFKASVDKTRSEIVELQKRIQNSLEEREASIFDAHLLIVDDKMLMQEVVDLIQKKHLPADHAFSMTIQRYITAISTMSDQYLKERADDVKDVASRIINNLKGLERPVLDHLPRQVVIIARDLTPSDTALLDRKNVLAFAVETGSRTSHTAILARSMKIPAVVGMQRVYEKLQNGDLVIIDGFIGIVIINPKEETLELYRLKISRKDKLYSELLKESRLRAETMDGYCIQLAANTEGLEDLDDIKRYGAEGIGLFRTEYLFMNTSELPDEEAQFQVYRRIAEEMQDQPVVIRTLDLGGDKLSSTLSGSYHEPNPFLGLRAIRLCFDKPAILRTQMRAILRAGVFGTVRMLFPMISSVDEVEWLLSMLGSVREELMSEHQSFDGSMKIGLMIEIPSAAIIAEDLASRVDFFSIGTNDLVQYSLAVDRGNEKVAYLYRPTHPAILELIGRTVSAARKHNIWVSVCGEMAGDPRLTPILLGLGVQELSMSPIALAPVRRIIRRMKMHDAEALAEKALDCENADESLQLSQEMVTKIAPDIVNIHKGF